MNDIVNAVSGAAVITISIPALYAGWKLFCSVKEKLKKEFQNGMSRELKIINEKLEKKSELSHELVCGVILKTIDKRDLSNYLFLELILLDNNLIHLQIK